MRKSIILLLVGVSAALAETQALSPAQQADAYYTQGVAAEKNGDVEAARLAYTKALQANPNLATCRYRLNQLKIDGGEIAARGREAKFGKVIVPAYQLDGATMQEALAALALIIDKESKGQVVSNFVIQDPQAKLAASKITLNLKSLPAAAVMKYLMTQANAKVRYDEHAVVVEPK
ncbi:MAG: tetratricopeptide repeat protein [Verrucomicrobia bacterium]|nr:tetratricopeptide repeat protein [Verrucomicrobiota bacterium]